MSIDLRGVPLFAGLADSDLDRIRGAVSEVPLAAGAVLFREGETGDAAYVVVSGELEIVKDVGGRTTFLARRGPGEIVGEMALLQDEPRIATVRGRTPTVLLRIPRAVMDEILDTSPTAMRSVYATLLTRTRETGSRLRQFERLAQLGTLTAGIAHELNNPAAAARRAARELEPAVSTLLDAVTAVAALGAQGAAAVAVARRSTAATLLGTLERSDAEDDVERWLEQRDVAEAWRWSPQLVDAGLTPHQLDELTRGLEPEGTHEIVRLLTAAAASRRLAEDVAEAAGRISALVARLRSHTFLDREPVQHVDVTTGIEDSLALLAHKLEAVHVVRDYGTDVPTIRAVGGDLNQVWISLLDNAADAVTRPHVEEARITVRVRRHDDGVMIEVEDNGPGIPPDVVDRVFDAFFTTKEPGRGSGLGLNLSYEIVAFDNHGELTVESRPGRTVFRVELPSGPVG